MANIWFHILKKNPHESGEKLYLKIKKIGKSITNQPVTQPLMCSNYEK